MRWKCWRKQKIVILSFLNVLTLVWAAPALSQSSQEDPRYAEIGQIFQGLRDSFTNASPFLSDEGTLRLQNLRVQPAKFEAVYRSSKALAANISAGISLRDYGNLLQPLVTDVSILEDKVGSADEKFLFMAFQAAANIYSKADAYWSYEVRKGDSAQDLLAKSWLIAKAVLDNANNASAMQRQKKIQSQRNKN